MVRVLEEVHHLIITNLRKLEVSDAWSKKYWRSGTRYAELVVFLLRTQLNIVFHGEVRAGKSANSEGAYRRNELRWCRLISIFHVRFSNTLALQFLGCSPAGPVTGIQYTS
jgi:hypothetical protein